jgi:hypothetical protein
MELTHTWVDVDRTLAACHAMQLSPHVVIPRRSGEDWIIIESPILLKGSLKWTFARTEDQISIPLIKYQLDENPAKAMGYLFGLGASLSMQIKRLHLVIGAQVEEIPQAERVRPNFGISYYLGVGLIKV